MISNTSMSLFFKIVIFLVVLSIPFAVCYQVFWLKKHEVPAKPVSFKKIRIKGYVPDVSFYKEGELLTSSLQQIFVGILALLAGGLILCLFVFLLKAALEDGMFLFVELLMLIAGGSSVMYGAQLLWRMKEAIAIDSDGFRGQVRIIPQGNYWSRLRFTPMKSFDVKWEDVAGAQLEVVYVGIIKEVVMSLYSKDSKTEPLVRVDFMFFGFPEELVDLVNYYYAIGKEEQPGDIALIRPVRRSGGYANASNRSLSHPEDNQPCVVEGCQIGNRTNTKLCVWCVELVIALKEYFENLYAMVYFGYRKFEDEDMGHIRATLVISIVYWILPLLVLYAFYAVLIYPATPKSLLPNNRYLGVLIQGPVMYWLYRHYSPKIEIITKRWRARENNLLRRRTRLCFWIWTITLVSLYVVGALRNLWMPYLNMQPLP